MAKLRRSDERNNDVVSIPISHIGGKTVISFRIFIKYFYRFLYPWISTLDGSINSKSRTQAERTIF